MSSEVVVPRTLLTELQWHWQDYDDKWHIMAGYYCPDCQSERSKGHSDTCEIALALAAPPKPPRVPVGYRVRFYKEPDRWMVNWDKPIPDEHQRNPNAEYQELYAD